MGEPGTKELLSLEELEAAGGAAHRPQAHPLDPGREQAGRPDPHRGPVRAARLQHRHARGRADRRRALSRITLTLDGAMHPIDQVTKQLHKLVNVLKIRDLEPADTVARELALFKVAADGGAARARSCRSCEIFRGKVVDVTQALGDHRGHRHDGQDRGVRAHGPPVRPDRDDAHRRDRDLARARRDLSAAGAARRAVRSAARRAAARRQLDAGRARAAARRASRAARAPRARARPARRSPALTVARRARRRPDARSSSPRGARGEPWFCFEQPDRDGAALAALGVRRARSRRAGPTASTRVAARWRALAARRRRATRPTARAAPGLVAVGGFAFAPDGGARAALGAASRRRRCTCPRSRSRAAAATCG